MWRLINISAKNICAFHDLSYQPNQGCTTLIFGNNLDNDTQGSNGSGKSALIEAIAIGLTGDSLRKVKADEIINDNAEEAEITLQLSNPEIGSTLTIQRNFSRSNPQSIVLTLNGEEVIEATVLDYDRRILDILGLTKDDIFSNYILSKHKYKSFLNASDREKKELINRFSNGDMVDESLDFLHQDMDGVQEELREAEKVVANKEGRVASIVEQIDSTRNEADEKMRRTEAIIQGHKEAIARNRTTIREAKQSIQKLEETLGGYDTVDAQLRTLEDSTKSVYECYNEIAALFKKYGLQPLKDYIQQSEQLSENLSKYRAKADSSAQGIKSYTDEVQRATKAQDELQEAYIELQASQIPQHNQLIEEIKEAKRLYEELNEANNQLINESGEFQKRLAQIRSMLAGQIECPKCHHQFVLESDKSVDELTTTATNLEKKIAKHGRAEKRNKDRMDETVEEARGHRKTLASMEQAVDELAEKVRSAKMKTNNLQSTLAQLQTALKTEQSRIAGIEQQIAYLRQGMFDDAFDKLDAATNKVENDIDTLNLNIENANGAISSYQEAIKQLQEATVATTLEDLEAKKAQYDKELAKAISAKDEIETRLAELMAQETRFIEFKTHLANTKIDALNQITNEFLEQIGSDIRISFSGFTTLKSGKVRDKISISLLRDGLDCGSFGKFSAGEQCRVNLASILALHKLTNVNCPDDKGLDLLILDEVLDATDESGLAHMFDALNSLQITSLVVSHGLVSESYPYRLIITKQNGISTLNEHKA